MQPPPQLFRPYFERGKEGVPTEKFLYGEWLVTNGLGGYSSSTVIGVMTRKYHGLLVSALPPPYGRTIMLNHLIEELIVNDKTFSLNCEETSGGNLDLCPLDRIKAFYLENGLPVWRLSIDGVEIEKRIIMPYRQNTVYVCFKLLSGAKKIVLRLHPAIHFRPHDASLSAPIEESYTMKVEGSQYEVSRKDFPCLRFSVFGAPAAFTLENRYLRNVFFRIEQQRGYEAVGELWTPGYCQIECENEIALVASTEEWKTIYSLNLPFTKNAEKERRQQLYELARPNSEDRLAGELILAADQFIVKPEHRFEDATRAHASGDEIRTIIAGYHWFNDWGRDTMISLEGLTLCTKRFHEARWILKTFAHYVRDGLIPNMFPEGQQEGLYHTADASLWYFHAISRYLAFSKNLLALKELLPTLHTIIQAHIHGTHFGICADPRDGLITQGAAGYQLTWMDAKVGEWVVTPRRGKTVEINALWYNALKLMESWMSILKDEEAMRFFGGFAERVRTSFNDRFWVEEKGYLYDVIDGENGDDAALRPNQLLAISLTYPVLDEKYWKPVVDKCHENLLTPFGLRTLSPDHPDFKARYAGDIRARDAAYHQGTVWPWLIGPFIDAWLKVYPDKKKEARLFLIAFESHLADAGVGTIGEIFNAMEPYLPQGCMAQAWSVAEVLRCWIKTT